MSRPNTNVKNASFDDNFVPSMLIKDASTNETVAVSSETPIPTSGNISSSRLTSISDWDIIQTGSGDIISSGGNTNASRYISIAKSNLNPNQITILASKQSFRIPAKINLALTSSLTATYQEFFAGIVKVNTNGSIATETLPTPLAMPATISVTSNVATVVINNHGLRPNARVSFAGMARSAFNINAIQITIVDANTFTFPLNTTNGTYNAGGFVYVQEPGYNFAEFSAMQWISVQTAALTPIKIAGEEPLYSISGIGLSTLVGSFASNTIGSDAILPAGIFTMTVREDMADWQAINVDTTSQPSYTRRNQISLDPTAEYKVVVFARNNQAITRPIARITNIAKTGTATATVTTDVPHGLSVDSTISIYGVLDITNFPNLTTVVQVTSIVNSTTFTCVIGSAVTATSQGGSVILQDGSTAPNASFINLGVKNISRTNGITLVDVGTTASGLTAGEKVYLHGLQGALTQYEGLYSVYAVNTPANSYQLVGLVGDQSVNYTLTATGGSIMKACDYRIHSGTINTFSRQSVELAAYTPAVSESMPVYMTVNPTVTLGSGTVTSVTSSQTAIPGIIVDIASAAITTTTTASSIAPTFGTAYSVSIVVTAVSGTSPTMDVGVEESDDSGTNWVRVYDFERITATGLYRSAPIMLRGNRVRYVQTIAGTTPSFTRAVNRLQSSAPGINVRQFIDRTIAPNTLSSTTPIYNIEGCDQANITVICSAQTTPATLALEFSDDGSNWLTSAVTVTTAVGIVQAKSTNEQWKFARLKVTTAGTGITLSLASIKAKSVS